MNRIEPSSSGRLRVLIAESDAPAGNSAARLLEQAGHLLVPVHDASGLLKLVARESFELIVLDLELPKFDVVVVSARVRAQERKNGGHVPILVLTSQTGRRGRQACLAAGADSCLSRPLDRVDFLGVVGQLREARPPVSRPQSAAPSAPQGIEMDEDTRLFRRLQAALIEKTYLSLEKLRAAISAREAVTVHRMAEGLKGALIIFKADQAAVRAAELVESGARGDLREARRLLPMLEAEMSAALAKARTELHEAFGQERPWRNVQGS